MFGLNFNHPGSVFFDDYRRQLAATLIVNILGLSHGIGTGWVSPMLFKLQSVASPLGFAITVEEASWIGALISVGGVTGNVIFGCLLDRIGRKKSIYLLAVPHMGQWVAIFFASKVRHLYIARVLAGMTGGGLLVVVPIFVSEIADCNIRGTLGSILPFANNIGILSGFIISSHVPYLLIPCIVLILPILFAFLWIPYPETAHHLLRKGLAAEAENSMKFYKNYRGTTTEDIQNLDTEFNVLKASIVATKREQHVSMGDFCTKRSLKAIGCGIVLMFVYKFSGSFAIINYSTMIFAATGSTMDPTTNTIIIGAVQIVGSYTATILVDRHGRKILLLISTSGMSLGMTAIGVYSYLAHQIDLTHLPWIPVVTMSIVIFVANIGVLAVTFVVLVEILPPNIRSVGATLCLSLLSIFSFAVLKVFPVFMDMIGLSGVMWTCASVAGFGFIFILICLRETKGKSLDDDSSYD